MAQNDVVFSITAIDKASLVFDQIGDSADQMAKDAKKAFEDLKASMQNINQNGQQATQSFGKMAGAFSVGAVGAMAFAKALEVAGAGISEFFKANDAFEKYKLQFKTLLGSTDEAEKRIAELSQFAASTPFELEGIAKASKTLQTFGGSVFATGENLRLVGDAAAMADVPIEELAVTVGRAYSGLQSGRPIGEAMQRFQELGLVSGKTRNEIEDLQKVGKNQEAWIILQQSLGVANGTMQELSNTLGGLKSTLQDDLTNAFVAFGQNSGVIEAVRIEMQGLHESFNPDGVSDFANSFKTDFLPSLIMAMELARATGNVLNSFLWQPIKLVAAEMYDLSQKVVMAGQILKGDFKGAALTHANSIKELDSAYKGFGDQLKKTFIETDYIDNADRKVQKILANMNKQSGVKKKEASTDFVGGGNDKAEKQAEKESEKLKKKQEKDEKDRQKSLKKYKSEEQIFHEERIDREKKQAIAMAKTAQKVIDESERVRVQREIASRQAIEDERAYQDAKNETISMSIQATKEIAEAFGANHDVMKGLMIAETVWNTSLAVMKTLSVGGAFAMPQAIAIGAMGAAQVAKISQYEKGGYIQGARHSQGGVMAELEGGEFVYSRKDVQNMGGATAMDRMRKSAQNISLGGFSPVINIHSNSGKVDGITIVKALESSMPEFSKMLNRQARRGFAV